MKLTICATADLKAFVGEDVTHVISLLDPEEMTTPLPVFPQAVACELFCFHDLDDIELGLPQFSRCTAPAVRDVSRISSMGRSLNLHEDWHLLTHCEAGVSRSAAAALIALCAAGFDESPAFRFCRRAAPDMLPNRRMIRLFDQENRTGLLRLCQLHREAQFRRAGYEDPTEILLRNSKQQTPALKSFLDALRVGLNPLAGSAGGLRSGSREQMRRRLGSSKRSASRTSVGVGE